MTGNNEVYIQCEIIDLNSAIYLLTISLVFSKHLGMIVGSFKKAWDNLDNNVSKKSLGLVFRELFVKYENPEILIKHLNNLTVNEVAALMHILQGNNMRTFSGLPIQLSKKESFILINELPHNLNFTDDILERTIIASKLLNIKSPDHHIICELLYRSKTFKHNLKVFRNDIPFWKNVLNFLNKINWSNHHLSITDFIDYFEYKKYNENVNYSIKNKTINSISKAIFDWHGNTYYHRKDDLAKLKWARKSEKDIFIKKDGALYKFTELINGEQLLFETKKLKHCVFSYVENCFAGYISIWGLKKEVDSIFIPYITIEVKENSIIQIAGKHDRTINDFENELIEEWRIQMDFKIQIEYCQ
jgi:hypothetical protein